LLAERQALAFRCPQSKNRALGIAHLPIVVTKIKLVQVLLQIAAPQWWYVPNTPRRTPQERSEAARKAVLARWGKQKSA